jgi:hypothetical protein
MSVFTGMTSALPGPGRREAEEFAALLDAGRAPAGHELETLVSLAGALAPTGQTPRPEFRAELRERLVAEAAARTPVVPTPRRRTREETSPEPRHRLRSAVATVVLTAVVAGGGAAAASTRALPGDVLYGLKRQIENVQLALAGSDLDRGREHLEQADARLGEAESLAASSSAGEPGTVRAIDATLAEMVRATDAGTTDLTNAYRETGDPEPMQVLDRFVADQRERLGDLLALLDPSLRARVLAQLQELDRVATTTTAVLGTSSASAVGIRSERTSLDRPDGWAVSRLSDRPVSSGGAGVPLAGAGDLSSTGSTGSGDGLVDSVTGVVGGGSSGGSSSSTSSPPLVGGGTTSVPSVGPVTSPLPTPPPSVTPLPTVTPLPSVEPSSVTSPLPSVPCVPVPPLTSC